MVLSWSLNGPAAAAPAARSKPRYDFRLEDQDWDKVCWGHLPKSDARSLPHQLSRRAKWAAVLRAAARPEGGGWRADFRPEEVTTWRLQALARVIDQEFFQGSFHRAVTRRLGRPLLYQAVDKYGDQAVQRGETLVTSAVVQSASSASSSSVAVPWATLPTATLASRRRSGLAPPLVVVRPTLLLPPPSVLNAVGGSVSATGSAGGGASGTSSSDCNDVAAAASGGGGEGKRWGWLGSLRLRRGSGQQVGGPGGASGGTAVAVSASSGGSGGRDGAKGGGRGGGGGRGKAATAAAAVPVVSRAATDGITATYSPNRGLVTFYRRAWSHSPTLGQPIRLDGIPCTTKLSWLAHTLGHEMLHVLLRTMCGGFSRDAPQNMALEGHGYNFLMLNWYVLGHRGHVYDTSGWRPPPPLPYRL
ncbi:hypothetical protein Agub_g879 [Astrephomene gubernaculifera]|uniref:Uncharacterized protein n=1 Tax=Astrephomene gubernaculifera TaxID=47775 RepID=A0AAD3DGH9_9CHLO|nr:hypothetical protein Agub_g879 [Astrephomene gubernaculifera]